MQSVQCNLLLRSRVPFLSKTLLDVIKYMLLVMSYLVTVLAD